MTNHKKKEVFQSNQSDIVQQKKKTKTKGSTKLPKNEERRKKWEKIPPVDI